MTTDGVKPCTNEGFEEFVTREGNTQRIPWCYRHHQSLASCKLQVIEKAMPLVLQAIKCQAKVSGGVHYYAGDDGRCGWCKFNGRDVLSNPDIIALFKAVEE